MTIREFLQSLKQGSYTSLGSYPLFYLMSDGATLCPSCACKERFQIARAIRDKSNGGWRAVAIDANWEDSDMACERCNESIPCAYPPDEPCPLGCDEFPAPEHKCDECRIKTEV